MALCVIIIINVVQNTFTVGMSLILRQKTCSNFLWKHHFGIENMSNISVEAPYFVGAQAGRRFQVGPAAASMIGE